jgi:hypothetical protein
MAESSTREVEEGEIAIPYAVRISLSIAILVLKVLNSLFHVVPGISSSN